MSLETGTRIQDLVATNPVGATDFVSQGDDHIRLMKACVQGSLPNLGAGQVTATAEELSVLDGVTATTAELNVLDGITPSTAELNYMDGVTSAVQGQLDAKASTSALGAAIAGCQPLDADLTAIAALTTASYGRGFLTLANQAALASGLTGISVPSNGGIPVTWTLNGASGVDALNLVGPSGTNVVARWIQTGVSTWTAYNQATDGHLAFYDGTAVRVQFTLNGGMTVGAPTGGDKGAGTLNAAEGVYEAGEALGYKDLLYRVFTGSNSTAATDRGRSAIYTGSGGHTFTADADLSQFATVILINSGSAALTIAASGSLTWFAGSGTLPTGNRTLAIGGVCTLLCTGSGTYAVFGNGLS